MANGAYSFDGSNDGINYPHISAIDGMNQLTVSFWIKPTGSTFYDYIVSQITDFGGTGPGNLNGFAVQHSSTDPTTIYLAFRNNSSSNAKITNSGVLSTGSWNHVLVVYDGTQGTATNRLRLWINGSEITSWATDTADFPTTLGSGDQPTTVGHDTSRSSGSGFVQASISDPALFLNQAITNGVTIAALAAGMSAGNYVTAGDFWASYRTNQNDENGGRTGTLVDAPTLTTGPSLTYPGGTVIRHFLALMGVGS